MPSPNFTLYTLQNAHIELCVLNIGATIHSLKTKNRSNHWTNTVLTYHDVHHYQRNWAYLGAVVGPTSGRIAHARFQLNHQTYNLEANQAPHHLHGGSLGLSTQPFTPILHQHDRLRLSYRRPALSDGYPGNLQVEVEYRLEGSTLVVSYYALSDETTLCDLTQHSYFNLNDSHRETILNHTLSLNADYFDTLDDQGMVRNQLESTATLPFNLKEPTLLSQVVQGDHPQLQAAGGGLDHPFLLNKSQPPAVTLSCTASGKQLQVQTDRPAIVCYTANAFSSQSVLAGPISGQPYAGICLEAQAMPNAINAQDDRFTAPILTAHQPWVSESRFSFDCI